jgi:putative restriction endonuclease
VAEVLRPPTPAGGCARPWPDVAELAASVPAEAWTLIGGLMVQLHAIAAGLPVVRPTETRCAMCRLRHTDLLDAAHIIRDADEGGLPVVPNGLSLCKIHHAAYDRNIIGVNPDLVIRVRRDILDEVDGPMLRHGIQEMDGGRLTVPRQRAAHPSRENLDRRYQEFLAAS